MYSGGSYCDDRHSCQGRGSGIWTSCRFLPGPFFQASSAGCQFRIPLAFEITVIILLLRVEELSSAVPGLRLPVPQKCLSPMIFQGYDGGAANWGRMEPGFSVLMTPLLASGLGCFDGQTPFRPPRHPSLRTACGLQPPRAVRFHGSICTVSRRIEDGLG